MTPYPEPPPDRVRAAADPCPTKSPANLRHDTAQDLLGLLGSPGNAPAGERTIGALIRRLPARATLFQEQTPAEAIHVVRTGTFKCSRTDADGDEHVLGFARRGDVLGYGAISLGHHTSTAVALEQSSVAVVPLAELFTWLQQLPALETALYRTLSLQHARAEEFSDVRAAPRPEARLAGFLLHWSHRMAISGQSMRQIKLVMSRRDIARLLSVTNEAVSRAFASLAANGSVAVTGRTVDILDVAALQYAARSPAASQASLSRVAHAAGLHRIPCLP